MGRVAVAVVAVGGTLLAGALLQDGGGRGPIAGGEEAIALDPAPAAVADAAVEAPADDEPVRIPDDPPAEAPAPTSGRETLAARTEADSRRLVEEDDAWTLQLMVACDPSNVERAVESLAGDRRLLVLPATIGGRDCYRVCWGPYATRAAAEAGRERLPGAARLLSDTPHPRPVSEVL